MKKIAMVLMLAGGIAAAGQASAQGWHGGGGGYYHGGGGYYRGGGGGYAGAAVVGAVAGLLIGSAVASAPRQQVVYAQPVYAQPVYAQPVYAAPPQYCYDAYGRGYACAPPVPVYGPQPGW